jgi:hypothetical protein
VGGRALDGLPELERATAWYRGEKGRLTLRAPGADLLRIAFRARAAGTTRVLVRAGGAVVREIIWRVPPRLADTSRWIEPQWIRVVLPIDAREATR